MNVAFNAIAALKQGQECHGLDVWQKYEEFGIDILDCANTPMHLLYLDIKKYIISMIPTFLKQRMRQNQCFGMLASKALDQFSLLVQGQQIHQQRWISQYQRLPIISLSGIYKGFPFSL